MNDRKKIYHPSIVVALQTKTVTQRTVMIGHFSCSEMADNQNLELNVVKVLVDVVLKIKKRLRVTKGRLKCIIIMLACVCAIVFTKM